MVDRITASGGWADLETQHKYEKWGRDILNTGVIAIVMTAPIGLVFIQMYGPKWLHRSDANGDMQLTQGRKPSGFTDLHEFSDVAFLEEVRHGCYADSQWGFVSWLLTTTAHPPCARVGATCEAFARGAGSRARRQRGP
jgi:hypothetical protein